MSKCAIDSKPAQFSIKDGGLWTAPVKQHQPVIINDYLQSDPRKKGYPAGHVFLSRFMGIPVMQDGRVVMIAGLANKAGDYDETDLQQASLLLEGVWSVIKRRRAEAALKESETRFRTLFEAIPDTVLVYDDDGTILHINEIGAQQLEWSVKDLEGRNLREIVTPENAFSIADHVRGTRKAGWSIFETTYVARSGWQIVAEIHERPIKFGKKKAILSASRDITERKRAEEALKKSTQLLRDTGEMAKVGGWELDLSTKEIFLAEELYRIHGLEPGYNLKQEEALDFYAPESRPAVEAAVKKAAETGEPYDLESLFIPSGSKEKIWVRSLGRAIYSGGKIVKLTGTFQNIDKYKRAEEALRKSEQQIRLVTDHITDVVWSMDLEGNFTFATPSSERIVGYTVEELLSLNFSQIIAPESYKMAMDLISKRMSVEKREPMIFEMEQVCKDGSKKWCEVTAIFLEDQNNRPTGIIGVTRDITARKQTEKALQESEEKYRNLVDRANDGICILQDVILQYVNPQLAHMVGYSPEEVIDLPFSDFSMPEEVPKVLDRYKRRMAGEDVSPIYESALRHKDGSRIDVELNAGLIIYKGKLADLVFVRDITERKRAEEALHESEARYQTLFEEATDGIALADAETGRLVDCNHALCSMVERDKAELIGQMQTILHPPEDRIEGISTTFRQHRTENPRLALEDRLLAKGGRLIPVEILAARIQIKNRDFLLGVFRDITKRKQAEEELQRSYDKLREALFTTVNTLASTVEMRDPYTAGHQRRATILACAIAGEMGLTEGQFVGLRLAGLIHDIGKITVPVEILSRPGRISETEFNIIKTHPQTGYNVLKEIVFPWPVAQIVLQHHERLNGSGYPQGLKDDKIILEAKILAVADVVEAMASHRPYRAGLGIEVALEEITKNRGVLYDPEAVDICTRLFAEKAFKFE